ncbi:MAG: molybdenum cofactor biosynthesis protein MoaE [Nitrososphaerales archaeon]
MTIQTGVYPRSKVDFGTVSSNFIRTLNKNTGSAVTFLGTARVESADGKKKIKYLVMESYESHANKILKKICREVKKKYDLNEIIIVHALGKFRPGEPVVLVALSSARRRESFKALREAVERYKKEPALFKQEIYVDNSSKWIS